MFWRRRKEAETEVADRDLEPTVEPSVPDDPLETVPPPAEIEAEDAVTPADDALLDADVEPEVEPEPEPVPVIQPGPVIQPEPVVELTAAPASPFAQPGLVGFEHGRRPRGPRTPRRRPGAFPRRVHDAPPGGHRRGRRHLVGRRRGDADRR